MGESNSTQAFTVAQVMARVGLGRDSVYKAIREGKLPAKKFGKRTLIVGSDLERFLQTLPTFDAVA